MSAYTWYFQEFDTDILGFNVAKVISVDPSGSERELIEKLSSLLQELKSKHIVYATYRIPLKHFYLIHAIEQSGFRLVDVYVNLVAETTAFGKMEGEVDPHIRKASMEDLSSLKKLGSTVFYANRLYNDPFILKEKADAFYAQWVENSVLGKVADLVLVWEEDGEVIGFVTLQRKEHIPLIGVSEKKRGQGIAKKLIQGALSHFLHWKVPKVEIETQLTNVPALRAYLACGFKIVDSHATFSWHI